MQNKTLLVTGHLGFIGTNFCRLYSSDFKIVGIDYRGYGAMAENLQRGVTDLTVDLANEERVRTALSHFHIDGIIHFAAESHVDRSINDDTPFWRSNVFGSRTIAKIALERKIRVLHVSTDEVYGDALESKSAWVETSPSQPVNPYAITKAAAEWLMLSQRRMNSLDVVITRGANTIGPYQFPEKAVPKAVYSFMKGVNFPLFKTPARRMWLDVDDHCSGIMAAYQKGVSGEVYNIAPDQANEVQTSDVIEFVQSQMGKGKIDLVEDRKAYDLRYWMDAAKAKSQLGWEPKSHWRDSIKKTINWYCENSEWLESAAKRCLGDGSAASDKRA